MRFVAGRGAAAKSHQEDVAGRGAAAKSYREDAAGRSSMGELLAGAPWGAAGRPGRCGGAVAGREPSAQGTASRYAAAKSYREDVAGRGAAVA